MNSFFLQESLGRVFPATMDSQILGKLFLFEMKFCTNGFVNWWSDRQIQPTNIICVAKSHCLLAETSSSLGHRLRSSLFLAFLFLHVYKYLACKDIWVYKICLKELEFLPRKCGVWRDYKFRFYLLKLDPTYYIGLMVALTV